MPPLSSRASLEMDGNKEVSLAEKLERENFVSAKQKRPSEDDRFADYIKSGRKDLNLRPLGPEPSALPG
jgi:hypothetical protein